MSGMFPVASFPCICYRTEDYHCVSVSRLFGSPLSWSIFVYKWPCLSVALTDNRNIQESVRENEKETDDPKVSEVNLKVSEVNPKVSEVNPKVSEMEAWLWRDMEDRGTNHDITTPSKVQHPDA